MKPAENRSGWSHAHGRRHLAEMRTRMCIRLTLECTDVQSVQRFALQTSPHSIVAETHSSQPKPCFVPGQDPPPLSSKESQL
jgi:hypothetical protein